MMDYKVDSIQDDIPELVEVLNSGGTVLYFNDEDMTDIFSGAGLNGMFVGFDPSVHTWVYAEIKGTINGEAWEISDSCEMPTISTDATLATFEVGGTDVLALGNVDVDDPINEPGATLSITEPVTGITITTNDAKARAEVFVNDLNNPVQPELLPTITIRPNDVIVVVVMAESGKTAYYKVTVQDTSPPSLQTAVVDGATLTLTYDEPLDTSSVPAATDFTVNVNSSAATVNNVAVSGTTVTLTLAAAVNAGDTVTVSYTAGTNPIQDISGNDAANLTDQSVNNNTQ